MMDKAGRALLTKAIADKCKAERASRGLTQPKMARWLGMAVQNYQRLEREEGLPRTDTLVVLAQKFDCTTDHLLGLDSDPT